MIALAYKQRHQDMNDITGIAEGVLHPEDVLYPESLKNILGKHAPADLYFKGNLSLLNKYGVGFCGSRNASEKGLVTAKDCSEQVAKHSLTIISGYAAGVDMTAHRTALESGGETIIVLPEGIGHFTIKKDLRDIWDWSRVLVLSQFKPSEIWQAYRAMTRNQVIIALSRAMIVIEAQEKGGTIEAGKSALKLDMPLFVAEYEDMQRTPGNSLLLQLGANKLSKNRLEGRAKLDLLFSKIENFSFSKHNQFNLL